MTVPKIIVEINEAVKAQEQAQEALWHRMDSDYSRWRLDPHRPNPEEGITRATVYTSNDLRTMADKAIAVLAESDFLARVISDKENTEPRDADNDAERFVIGAFAEGDRRLKASKKPGVQAQLAWMSIVRGGDIGNRAILKKDAAGETIVDITPFDPRHVVSIHDENGPLWAAVINRRSRATIKRQYPNFRFDRTRSSTGAFSRTGGSDQFRVLDYYERVEVTAVKKDKGGEVLPPKFEWHNGIIIDNQWAKKMTNLFAERPQPIFRVNGYNPGVGNYQIQDSSVTTEIVGISDFSESIMAANRGVVDAKSRILTYTLSLTARAVAGIYTLTSKGGTSEVDDSPNEQNQVIPLDSDKEEKLALLQISETTKDAQILLGSVVQEAIRGGLLDPSEIAGSNPSGRALRIMSQILREKLAPHERAVRDVMEANAEALLAQYETGKYRALTVVGVSHDLEGFNREIKPEDLKGHGLVQIELVPTLPEDDFERIQMAALAGQPAADGMALMSRRSRDTRILRVQDANLEMRRSWAERARQATELMSLWPMLEAAIEQQDMTAAAEVWGEIQRLKRRQQMEDFAREQAFTGLLNQSGIDAAAAGMGPSENGQSNGTGSPRNPLGGMAPESAPLSGQPIAGENTGAGRPPAPGGSDFEQQLFNTTGLVIAR
jgi:hypothetical protein